MTAHTLLLEEDWDLHVDAAGNLTPVLETYAVAQNVANAFRLFTDDAWFFPERGIAHFLLELNKHPMLNVLAVRLKDAAKAVEGVKACEIGFIEIDPDTRILSGLAVLTMENGETVQLSF